MPVRGKFPDAPHANWRTECESREYLLLHMPLVTATRCQLPPPQGRQSGCRGCFVCHCCHRCGTTAPKQTHHIVPPATRSGCGKMDPSQSECQIQSSTRATCRAVQGTCPCKRATGNVPGSMATSTTHTQLQSVALDTCCTRSGVIERALPMLLLVSMLATTFTASGYLSCPSL